MACPTGASQAPERFSALRPPLDAGERSKVASPGRRNAPRERDGLFDIVRWKLPKTVRRRAASLAVLILRSARAGGVSQTRTGVRASRRMRTTTPSCVETRRSVLGPWKRLRSGSAAMLLSMRARGTAFWRNEPNEHFGHPGRPRESGDA